MKHSFLFSLLAIFLGANLQAQTTHLDIAVPDLKDTDLKGPVKCVTEKLCRNVSGEFITEERTYDQTGNLLKIVEFDEDQELSETHTYVYDEAGSYTQMLYTDHQAKENGKRTWNVILNPQTHQIAIQEKSKGLIDLSTYTENGYITSERVLDDQRKQVIAWYYKRDENNRRTEYTKYIGNEAAYTYYFKWADNGFIDRERQHYLQEKADFLHTYEYLQKDKYGNWTQRIMVRYRLEKGGKEKVYEHTVQRKIEYYEETKEEPDEET